MPNMLFALLVGAGSGLVVYGLTRFALGSRADNLIGGAIPIALFVPPGWAALAGALLGHILGVVLVRLFQKKNIPRHIAGLALVVTAAYWVSVLYTFNSTLHEAASIAQSSYNQTWQEFALQGQASRFVADNYRPCIDATSRTILAINAKHDPSVCRSSAVTLAASTYGQQFAMEVDSSITKWNQRPGDMVANAKIDKLAAAL